MSRSRPNNNISNPAKRTMEWKGSIGKWEWWDRDAKEKRHVESVRFAVLDQLASVCGYAEAFNASGFSNEVHSTKREPLQVKVFRGKGKVETVARGLYSDIKGDLPKGLKFAKIIYALDVDTDEIVRLILQGAALNQWIELDVNVNGLVKQTGTIEGKKGAVTFQMPVFEEEEITQAQEEAAVEADQLVQDYLDSKKALQEAQPEPEVEPEPATSPIVKQEPEDDEDEDDPIPF